ncbi:FBH1 helicase, partial [Mionectes macconnelli]|nr:FBH1 helicase [Mionectes macconnelli]
FIPWKKLYHQYLMKEESALRRVEQILQEFSITKKQEGCVLGLVTLVSAAPVRAKVDPDAVLRCLGSHPLFSKARECVANKLPRLRSETGPEKMWATVAVMVLFSGGVGDIQSLVELLRRPSSNLSMLEVTEVLYCMATLLFAMRDRNIPITNRIHYNIFHCLYLMENSSMATRSVEEEAPASRCRQDFWDEVKLTHEQQRILNHRIEPGQIVKIMAFAGTGKTSTLAKYAAKFPELNFLYVTFNRAVAEKGKRIFPRNVTCKTFHSLAYGSVGKQGHFRAKTPKGFRENLLGWEYLCAGSNLSKLSRCFLPPLQINVEEAKEIWHNMKKLDGDVERKYLMTSDGKRGSKSQLLSIVDVVLAQPCGIILVGDPHQQIYTFRGAVGTLRAVRHSHVYYLSQSFRFGPEIAYVGATILDVCKGIRNKTLVGG